MNNQLIISTESFANATEYVNAVKKFAPKLAWDTVKDWRTLCKVLNIDFEVEAKGKARPAIDKVAKRLAGSVTTVTSGKVTNTTIAIQAPAKVKPEVKPLPEIKSPKQYGTPDAWAVAMNLPTGQGWTKMARNLGLQCADGEGQRAIYKAYVQQKQDGNGENVRVVVETKEPVVENKPAVVEKPAAPVAETKTEEPMPKRTDFRDEDEFDAAFDVWYRENRMPKTETKASEPVAVESPSPAVVEQVATEAQAEPTPVETKKPVESPKKSEKKVKAPVEPVAELVAESVPEPAPVPTPAPVEQESTDIEETARLIAQALAGLKNPAKPVDPAQIADMVKKSLAEFEERLDEKYSETLEQVNHVSSEITKKLEAFIQNAGKIEVTINGTVTGKVDGVHHERFEDILRHVSVRDILLLVGPAGSGKTTACEQVATALGLDFYCKSVCAQTSKSELLGYMDANGRFVTTEFRTAYEQGGVFVLDEMDAGNPNVIAVLNSALANGYCAFADMMVRKHDDFVLVACANTFGTGADRQYVGRNQLDAATLDRFSMIEFGYDQKLETKIAPDKTWCSFIQAVRQELKNERVVISPRATIQGGKMMATGAKPRYIMEVRVMKGMDKGLRGRVENIFTQFYK